MKQKILCIVGTRPEVIKMVPVIRELRRRDDLFETALCVTGQHREMVDSLLEMFGIVPEHDLQVMRPNQTLGGLTSLLFSEIDQLLAKENPDWVLAQGDTTTVFVAATVAYYHKVKFGHVEAGLRTGNKHHPFPEEINRVFADHAADLLFAPTETSRANLLREGLPDSRIIVTGNTVVDTLQMALALPYDWPNGPLGQIDRSRPIVLVTTHRRESFGSPLRDVLEGIRILASEFPSVQFIFPVHLNPNVRAPVMDILGQVGNVFLKESLDYLSLVNVMGTASLILTDSGGIQEEGASLGIPVLVMRETTERPEGLAGGFVELVGTDRELLVAKARSCLQSCGDARMRPEHSPYGDGRSAEKIVNAIEYYPSSISHPTS